MLLNPVLLSNFSPISTHPGQLQAVGRSLARREDDEESTLNGLWKQIYRTTSAKVSREIRRSSVANNRIGKPSACKG